MNKPSLTTQLLGRSSNADGRSQSITRIDKSTPTRLEIRLDNSGDIGSEVSLRTVVQSWRKRLVYKRVACSAKNGCFSLATSILARDDLMGLSAILHQRTHRTELYRFGNSVYAGPCSLQPVGIDRARRGGSNRISRSGHRQTVVINARGRAITVCSSLRRGR